MTGQLDVFADRPRGIADDLDKNVRAAWVAFLNEPEAADILTIVCETAMAPPAANESRYLNGDDLIRAVRQAGHKVDNRLRGPFVRYAIQQHPSTRDRFRLRKGKAA